MWSLLTHTTEIANKKYQDFESAENQTDRKMT
jgi:hypothetical protein